MIIVKHNENGKKYILLGTGYGAFKATRPSYFGGNLFPKNEEGTYQMVAITDETNKIFWCPSKDLTILSADGKTISEWLTD